jgi:hypothetical protein
MDTTTSKYKVMEQLQLTSVEQHNCVVCVCLLYFLLYSFFFYLQCSLHCHSCFLQLTILFLFHAAYQTKKWRHKCWWRPVLTSMSTHDGRQCWGVSEIPDKIPEHKRRMYSNVQFKVADEVRGDEGSPRNCSCLKSCESSYTCPHAPFYRETKGLLHSDNTLELKEYS